MWEGQGYCLLPLILTCLLCFVQNANFLFICCRTKIFWRSETIIFITPQYRINYVNCWNVESNSEFQDQCHWISGISGCIQSMHSFLVIGSAEALNRVVIVAPPQNATVVLGRPAVMECMAQGQPKPLVSWSRQGNTPKCSHSIFSLCSSQPLFFSINHSFIACVSLSNFLSLLDNEQ